ncbi:LOW QUALITY PROTEIN: uncharacterized protein LOC108087598 [Drosophila ficusphila]|uniref:LOW QUALITY PROTEIN: uncharacterized protein LOC108087598 n=1 Tax=Drosophila ficusphila TaxID=30025 RepID=UPI0007E79D42|nr:LOW QUALITY PROTEIN: uncharacterized protein LOC108087598 [Drosophila ficusphila]
MSRTRIHSAGQQSLLLLLPAVLLLLMVGRAMGTGLISQTNKLPSQRFFYASSPSGSSTQTKDAAKGSCCQGAAAEPGKPLTIPLTVVAELSNVTTSDYDASGESLSSKEHVKRSTKSPRNATPATCSPQPTVVELKPSNPDDELNFYYIPSCTRINRCGGCCGSNLISCQPTEVENVELRVRQVNRGGGRQPFVIINVEEHTACRCDCTTKAKDCNAYQTYREDLCRCQCNNNDAREKCLEQGDTKYWVDDNCACVCRYNQSCTTGTYFDETQCKCTDPFAPVSALDRKRFIVQAVQVDPDNTTLYSV